MDDPSAQRLRQEIVELAPWTMDVEVADGVTTATAREVSEAKARELGMPLDFSSPRHAFVQTLQTIYPTGIEQRSFLDCGCNCGAFCFWAKELGAGRAFGFDVREHWIRQAELIQRYRKLPLVEFAAIDIFDLPRRPMPRFDITLVKGLVHLLSDPVTGLKIAADLTREVLILNTPVSDFLASEPEQGGLFLNLQRTESLLGAAGRVGWLPSGPNVLVQLLKWLGFEHVKVHYQIKPARDAEPSAPNSLQGRVEVIAARLPGLIDRLQSVVHQQ